MLIGAAVLLLVMSVFHSLVGERYVLGPIKANNTLPEMWGSRVYTFRTIQATWHLVSALWLGLAVYWTALSVVPDQAVQVSLIAFGVLFGVLAIVPLVWDSGEHKSYIPFGLISVLLLASALI